MIKNYIKVAWRNLIRNRASSSINVGGLAVGINAGMEWLEIPKPFTPLIAPPDSTGVPNVQPDVLWDAEIGSISLEVEDDAGPPAETSPPETSGLSGSGSYSNEGSANGSESSANDPSPTGIQSSATPAISVPGTLAS